MIGFHLVDVDYIRAFHLDKMHGLSALFHQLLQIRPYEFYDIQLLQHATGQIHDFECRLVPAGQFVLPDIPHVFK